MKLSVALAVFLTTSRICFIDGFSYSPSSFGDLPKNKPTERTPGFSDVGSFSPSPITNQNTAVETRPKSTESIQTPKISPYNGNQGRTWKPKVLGTDSPREERSAPASSKSDTSSASSIENNNKDTSVPLTAETTIAPAIEEATKRRSVVEESSSESVTAKLSNEIVMELPVANDLSPTGSEPASYGGELSRASKLGKKDTPFMAEVETLVTDEQSQSSLVDPGLAPASDSDSASLASETNQFNKPRQAAPKVLYSFASNQEVKPLRVTRVEDWTPPKSSRSEFEMDKAVDNFFGTHFEDSPDFVVEATKSIFHAAGKVGDFVKSTILEEKDITPPGIPDPNELSTTGMTERIMNRIPSESQASGAGGQSTYEAFLQADQNWSRLRNMDPNNLPEFLMRDFVLDDGGSGDPRAWTKLNEQQGKELDYDVVVCGGTLGIFFATALQLRGLKVCVIEAGKLRGREQEWNISMDELMELVELGVLSQEDIDAAIKTEFPACRSGFKNREVTPVQGGYFENGVGFETATEDVLNLGVSPTILIERAFRRFKEIGGVVREETRLKAIHVSSVAGTAMDLGDDNEPVTARLVLDCMGNASPVSRQQRRGVKPDGVCAVVGSCAAGFEPKTNVIGDIIYTNQEIVDKKENGKYQYFWEAFPVGIGREGKEPGSSDVKTTYMFTYMDADKDRISLQTLMDDYWKQLPKYQPSIENPETDLDFRRVLFAYFPTYRDSPLKPAWDRVLAVGDASGIQSPLSFGGFGALSRHLGRITDAVGEAIDLDMLSKEDLAEINAYTPNLSAAWMFQKAMSVRVGQNVDSKFVNRLLAVNFQEMDKMGLRTMKPFLQDVVRFDGLIGSLARSFKADPTFMPEIVAHVGLPTLANWLLHVGNMGLYSFLDFAIAPIFGPVMEAVIKDDEEKFRWRRRMEAWKYGSGGDYKLPTE